MFKRLDSFEYYKSKLSETSVVIELIRDLDFCMQDF